MAINEQIKFRLLQMPCCNTQLCWVNPRLPTYCAECGESVYLRLKSGEYTRMESDGWLKVNDPTMHRLPSDPK